MQCCTACRQPRFGRMNFEMSPAACCLATTLVATLRDDSVSGCRVRCIHLDSTVKDELPYAKCMQPGEGTACDASH